MKRYFLWILGTLAIGFVGGIVGNCSYHEFNLEPKDKFEVYRDVLVVLLALLGSALVAAGYGLSQWLRRDQEEHTRRLAEETENKLNNIGASLQRELMADVARYYTSLDDVWGKLGEALDQSDQESTQQCWVQAAQWGEAALDLFRRFELEKATRGNDLLLYIANNLGFDYAYLGQESRREQAHELVEILKASSPQLDTGFLETCYFVAFRLPRTPKEKEDAILGVKALLDRYDIDDETKNRWKRRYNIT